MDANELPTNLQDQFVAIRQGLQSVRPLPGESAVQATVRKMSVEQANLYAGRIVDLFGEVARLSAPAPVTRAAEPAAVAPFRERTENNLHVVPMLYAAEA